MRIPEGNLEGKLPCGSVRIIGGGNARIPFKESVGETAREAQADQIM